MLTFIQYLIVLVGLAAAVVTLLSLTTSSRWPLRIWDFPRMQIAAVSAIAGVSYAIFFYPYTSFEWAFLAITFACTGWQVCRIYPFTRLARPQVERSRGTVSDDDRFRLFISNVQMENTQYHRLLQVIRESDPDLVLLVETDQNWERALESLKDNYSHGVRQVQDNYYGLMLFSRLPLVDPRIEFLIQDDIPSVHTGVELRSGKRIVLHGLHPRPPEPLGDQDSTPRDAELVVVGRMVGDEKDCPTIVAGDLNDVAWSQTSRLFLRLSGLLDPRIGRGFYNSFDVNNPLCRYPLDHVYHSNHFRLVDLRRLPPIGSDHFPMFIELAYEPDAPVTQSGNVEEPGDAGEADSKLEEQSRAALRGQDRPSRGDKG